MGVGYECMYVHLCMCGHSGGGIIYVCVFLITYISV